MISFLGGKSAVLGWKQALPGNTRKKIQTGLDGFRDRGIISDVGTLESNPFAGLLKTKAGVSLSETTVAPLMCVTIPRSFYARVQNEQE